MSADSSETSTSSAVGLLPEDFWLAPEAFVERCAQVATVDENNLSSAERGRLAEQIRNGTPRLKVVQTIFRHFDPQVALFEAPLQNAMAQEWNEFVDVALLERYAPDDDEAFVRQAFSQILSRDPEVAEVLEYHFDLRTKRSTRRQQIERLAIRAPNVRLNTSTPESAESVANVQPGGWLRNQSGSEEFILVREVPGLGWLRAPNIFLQDFDLSAIAPKVYPGWIAVGPKQSVDSGLWHLTIDVIQPPGARLIVDVVCNSGLDTLFDAELVGSAAFSTCFEVKPFHYFLEVRLNKPPQEDDLHILQLRDISLSR